MSEENKTIARKLIEECWNKGRVNVVDEVMSSLCRHHDAVFPTLEEGSENFKRHIKACRKGFPDLNFTLEDEIAERDEVVVHWRARGTHRDTFIGMPATNKKGDVSGTTILRVEKSKIVESWSDWNLLTLLEQLGLAGAMQAQQPAAARR